MSAIFGKTLRFSQSEPPLVLAPLVEQPVTGDWLLRVTDAAQSDTGTLKNWRLEIITGS